MPSAHRVFEERVTLVFNIFMTVTFYLNCAYSSLFRKQASVVDYISPVIQTRDKLTAYYNATGYVPYIRKMCSARNGTYVDC